MTLKVIPCIAAFIIFSLPLADYIVYGLSYDKTFNVQPQPIQFLEEPKDHVTLAGADVTFVCSTTVLMSDGLFTPHTTWLYNNTTITSGDHYIISHNGDNTLTVKNVTRDDQGVYHCHVDDWKIKIRSRYGHLNVVESKNQTAFISATLESTITLPCSGLPGMKATWFKDSKEIANKTNQVLLHEDGSLILFNVNGDSGGYYQCLVEFNESNVIIYRNESFYITIPKSSKNSTRPRIHSTSSSQYLLIIPNHCGKSPHNQTVTLQCPVTGHPSPIISWYLNGNLVNLTDYNITDNVGNNTWIIQGGDPCRLIGYWQCFATNEAGTVHNEIRVLPYGWSTLPRVLTLNVIEVVVQDHKWPFALYNLSWQPPLYLGGLNLTDMKYSVTLHNYGRDIGAYTTNNSYVRILETVNIKPGLLKEWNIKVHIVCTQMNCKYFPANVQTEVNYDGDDLINTAINFLPPIFNVNCSTNGNVLLDWAISSSGNLSSEYLNEFVQGQFITGSCINQQGDVLKKHSDEEIGGNSLMFYNLPNGTTCDYTTYYVYTNKFISPSSRAYCTIIMDSDRLITSTVDISTSTSFILPQISVSSSDIGSGMEPSPSVSSTQVSTTALYNSSKINSAYSTYLSTSLDMPKLDVTKTLRASSVQISLSTLPIFNATHSTTYSAITGPSPQLYSDESNTGLPSGLLGTIIGLLLLLVVSAVVCSAAVVMHQRKSSRRIEDYKFLKVSRYLKNIKSPLSNNYCSTINIADESVCEMPVVKVMKWIDNNDFKHSADMLQQSSSFRSLTTAEMIAYISKKGKQKWPAGDCDEGKLQIEKLGFADNISCSQLSTSSGVPSHYHCEENRKGKGVEISSLSSETVCDHNSQCKSEVITLSEDSSFQLQTDVHKNRKPTDLFISEKSTNMPLFTPKVTNPIFGDSSPSTLGDAFTQSSLLQSFNETDLLTDILHTLPREEIMVDNDILSQMSDDSGVPSHYLYEGNKKRSLLSLDCDDSAHCHDASANSSNIQCDGENFLSQTSGDISCNVSAKDHAKNKKPANLSIPNKSVTMSLFTPKVTNPIFAESTNSSSADSNSFTSESSLLPQFYKDKDVLNFALHSQEMNDDVFSQASNHYDSDVPSHYLYERSCCNGKSRASLNESTDSPIDKTDDGSHEMEENVSVQNSSDFVGNKLMPRKSVSLPTIIPNPVNTNSSGITPPNLGISTSLIESFDKNDSPKVKSCTMFYEQIDSDTALSHLSINNTTPSHYMHGGDVFNKGSLSYYFDDIGNGQNDHKVDANNLPQASEICEGPLSDCCLNETFDANVVYSLNSIFVSNPGLHPTNPLSAPAQGELCNCKTAMEELDLDALSQFSDSDTGSELNACTDLDYDDFNAGYM